MINVSILNMMFIYDDLQNINIFKIKKNEMNI